MIDPSALALRPEPFGGILFDPLDATFVELDREAYDALAAFARTGSAPAEAAPLLDDLRDTLSTFDGRPLRLTGDPAIRPRADGLAVLSGPTLVDFQITDHCPLDCPHCYAESTPAGRHGALDDILMALDQIAEVGAFQLAIGGGEPLSHPHIGAILARCRALGMVPNLTTSGVGLTDAKLDLLADHCGAVGVSLEGVGDDFAAYRKSGFTRFERTVSALQDRGVPTVLQVTLNTDTFARLPQITAYIESLDGLYGVIFLAFKPVGRGAAFGRPLADLPPAQVHAGLEAAFTTLARRTRVGFDCCLTPAVAGLMAGDLEGPGPDESTAAHAADHLEGCSALRSSLGLSPTLDVMPCTFTAAHAVGNLKDRHLRDIWRDMATERWRHALAARTGGGGNTANPRCAACGNRAACLGGCPVMDLANCDRDYLGRT